MIDENYEAMIADFDPEDEDEEENDDEDEEMASE